MALVPEFISILRYIRDTVYPSVNKTYENAVDLNEKITTKKSQFDGDYSQFKNDYVDFNNSKIEISNAVISTNQSAQSASASALLATQKSNEIKNLTAQGQTLTAGSQAYASFNPSDGKLTIGIPAGLKGDKGDSFTINSSGITAQRALYNNQIKGWSFLDLETSTIYFKVSDASADWSLGAPFGKGDPGPEGEEGIGIVSFTFVSTTDTSGLPAQSGATDTYRITLTNSNTFDYQIYNGVDADSDFILGELATLNSEVEQLIDDTSGLSNIDAPYNLLKGEIYADNTVLTNGFSTTFYSGTSTTTDIVNDIDMDTQWGDSSNEKFGGLVWIKSRNTATNNFLFDTIRGSLNEINSNNTEAQASLANSLTKFNNNGFTLGNASGINVTGSNYVSWNFQTTHIKTGVTNHGKAYTEHYNPFTGFTIIKYEGSGITGHEIPHSLGRKLGFVTVKNLTTAGTDWQSQYRENYVINLNSTATEISSSVVITSFNDIYNSLGNGTNINQSGSQHIMYGWANSYFDEDNTLIGNYEVGIYQGTGAAGNKVKTRGKPAFLLIKRLDSSSSWTIIDNLRGTSPSKALYSDLSNIEASPSPSNYVQFYINGFMLNATTAESNASGGQYLYMVVYDNDSGSGKSKYPKTTENTNITLNNCLIPLANGINKKGFATDVIDSNTTLDSLVYSEGANYIYKYSNGFGVTTNKPNYGTVNPMNGGDFYDINKNLWYDTDNNIISESRNYLGYKVIADSNGNIIRVEKLKDTIYFYTIKANEYKGKNACTAWVNFDGTTTPPTIKNSYNVSSVIRTSAGTYDIYFEKPMYNINYCTSMSTGGSLASIVAGASAPSSTLKQQVFTYSISSASYTNSLSINVQIFGGKE